MEIDISILEKCRGARMERFLCMGWYNTVATRISLYGAPATDILAIFNYLESFWLHFTLGKEWPKIDMSTALTLVTEPKLMWPSDSSWFLYVSKYANFYPYLSKSYDSCFVDPMCPGPLPTWGYMVMDIAAVTIALNIRTNC